MQTKQFLLRFFLVLVAFCPSVHLLADPVTSGGYYYIISSNAWSYSDQTNAVYANGDYCKWGALKDHSSAYIWQFKLLSNGNYSVRNLLTDTYVNNISESKKCFLTSKSTSEVSLIVLTGDQYNVSVVEGGSGSHKMHCEAPTMPQADVQGNRVTLHWQPGSRKNVTHEVFIRDSQGRLLGNCRSYVGGELDGQRKCMDIGNLSYVDSVSYTLPEGRYTWGVQTVNASLQGSPFATGEFVIGSSDDVSLPAQSASQPTFYNALGQRLTLRQRGLRIVQYADGTTRKQFVR